MVENGSVKKAGRVLYYRGSCAGEKVYGEARGECCAGQDQQNHRHVNATSFIMLLKMAKLFFS